MLTVRSLAAFSTTSTLSAGSTGSQARLIQSSHQPAQYQPTMVKELGKQESRSLRSSPERKHAEKKIKVIRSGSGSSIDRDRSPSRVTIDRDRDPDRDRVTKVIVCKSPNKSNLKQSKSVRSSPRGSFDRARSPRGSIMKSRENSCERARSPATSTPATPAAPRKGIMRTPQPSVDRDRSPAISPAVSRRSSRASNSDRLARLGTNSLDRVAHYSQLAKAEDKAIRMGIVVSKSTESIAKAIEHPTCVQCYLSGKREKQSKTS